MKLPFVSRAAYDAMHVRAERAEMAQGVTQRELADARERVRESCARVQGAEAHAMAQATLLDSVLIKYHQLKLQGFTLPAEAKASPVQPQSLSFEADTKIGRVIAGIPASRDPKVRTDMWKQVATDRANHVPDEEIILRIQRGNRPAEEGV